jgi:hypothetical protein
LRSNWSVQAAAKRARQLLVRANAAVTEICFEVGYQSLGSFSTLFRLTAPSRSVRRISLYNAPLKLDKQSTCISVLGAVKRPPQTRVFFRMKCVGAARYSRPSAHSPDLSRMQLVGRLLKP